MGSLRWDLPDYSQERERSPAVRSIGDWLDRLELLIRLEDLTGVEITHDEADRFECVGDLIQYISEKQRYVADGHRQGHRGGEFRRATI